MNTHARAFTLIETLVAVSVLLIAIAGPLTIASNALQGAYYARDQVTAFYLAQEGVEYVRAVRDQNFLRGDEWLSGLTNCLDVLCYIDFPNFSHAPCEGECPRVLRSVGEGLFNHEGGESSLYTRSVTIKTIPGVPHEVVVSVVVSWRVGGLTREFEIQEHLFQWL